MKDNLIVVTLVVFAILAIVACAIICIPSDVSNAETNNTDRFVVVDEGHINSTSIYTKYYILMDKETGIEYYFSDGKYNRGSLTPLYNVDGSLKIHYIGE